MLIKSILIVDDSSTDRLSLAEMLVRAFNQDLKILIAETGEQGIVVAETELPDLILMDIIMPGMTGFQATRALSKNPKTAHIPIIVCTGKSQATDQAWALKMGAKSCLAKPIIQAELMASIGALD
ncbi:MAG TPA: response regulator [Methylophilaceae bacterium]|jgi:twitching motility two-component system response regulator PilH